MTPQVNYEIETAELTWRGLEFWYALPDWEENKFAILKGVTASDILAHARVVEESRPGPQVDGISPMMHRVQAGIDHEGMPTYQWVEEGDLPLIVEHSHLVAYIQHVWFACPEELVASEVNGLDRMSFSLFFRDLRASVVMRDGQLGRLSGEGREFVPLHPSLHRAVYERAIRQRMAEIEELTQLAIKAATQNEC